MTPEKKTDHAPKPSAPVAEGGRKPWIPKTPVEVVLEQIGKVEKKVADLQAELDSEKSMLTKLLQAKKVLE
jgi:antitoxin component HigA of HigAB toxin-antitoxin module